MADRTLIGSLIVRAEVEGGAFAAGMSRLASTAAKTTSSARAGFDATTVSVNRLHGATNRSFRMGSFIAASRIFDNLNHRAEALRATLLGMTSVFGGFSAALATNAVIGYADSYKELQNRLRVVTGSQQELLAVQEALFKSAQDSRTGFRETAVLYSRLAIAARNLGLSQRQIIDITDTIQKAFRVGGSTSIEATQAAIQLSQGIAANRLSGDELRSVLENVALSSILAKQITGGNVGALRKLAEEGKLTAATLAKAFMNSREEINSAFAKISPTIADSFVQLDNALMAYIGGADQAVGASKILINAIGFIKDNIAGTVNALVILGGVLIGKFAIGALTPLIARVGVLSKTLVGVVGAERALRIATVSGALATQQSAVAARAAAAAELQRAQAANVAAVSLAKVAQIQAVLSAGTARAAAATAAAATAAAAAATSQAALAAATRAYGATAIGATLATGALGGALRGLSAVAIAAGGAMRAIGAIVGFLGGPLNIALLAAGAAWYYLATRETEADRVASAHMTTMQGLREHILNVAGATDEQREAMRRSIMADYDKAVSTLRLIMQQRELAIAMARTRIEALNVSPEGAAKIFARVRGETADALQASAIAVQEIQQIIADFDRTAAGAGATLDETGEMAEKLANKLKELRLEAAAGPLTDFNREVVETARQAGIAEAEIQKFILALHSAQGLENVDQNILEIYDLLGVARAWEEYRGILQTIGPTMEMIGEKQSALTYLVNEGAITAGQAQLAFANWISSFEAFEYIDGFAQAFESLLVSLGDLEEGWKSVGDAARKFALDLIKVAYQILVVEPLVNGLRSWLGQGAGGGGGPLSGLLGAIFGGAAGGLGGGRAMGGGGGAGVFHGGGVVGQTKVPMRMVPGSIFANAPRYHDGAFLGPREHAAILEKGETVLPADAGPMRVLVELRPSREFHAEIAERTERVATKVTENGLSQYDRSLPSRVHEIAQNPRDR